MIETKKNEKSRLFFFFFFFYIFSLFFYRGCGGNFLFSFAKNALSLVVLLVKRLVVYLVAFDFSIFGNHSIYWASRCVVTWSLTWSFTWSLSWSVVGRLLGRFEKWCLRKRLYLLGFSLGRYLVVFVGRYYSNIETNSLAMSSSISLYLAKALLPSTWPLNLPTKFGSFTCLYRLPINVRLAM